MTDHNAPEREKGKAENEATLAKPFKAGQTVYTVDKVYDTHIEHEHSYDHLGPIDREVTVTDGYHYVIRKCSFTYGLLDKYYVDEIYINRSDAEKALSRKKI